MTLYSDIPAGMLFGERMATTAFLEPVELILSLVILVMTQLKVVLAAIN